MDWSVSSSLSSVIGAAHPPPSSSSQNATTRQSLSRRCSTLERSPPKPDYLPQQQPQPPPQQQQPQLEIQQLRSRIKDLNVYRAGYRQLMARVMFYKDEMIAAQERCKVLSEENVSVRAFLVELEESSTLLDRSNKMDDNITPERDRMSISSLDSRMSVSSLAQCDSASRIVAALSPPGARSNVVTMRNLETSDQAAKVQYVALF